MVAGWWEIGVNIAIHNKIYNITIWAISATKNHDKHSQQLNKNPFEFQRTGQVLSSRIKIVSDQY